MPDCANNVCFFSDLNTGKLDFMAQSVFHVTCVYADKPHEERKKRLVFSEGMTLTDAVFSLFNISHRSDHILQLYDSEFDDWLDVEEDTVLPTSRKLKLTICSGVLRH